MSIGDIMGGIGSLVGAVGDIYSSNKNVHLQKQFAQNSIQWKVADAKKAGIHPLYALGAQTHSFAPVQTGLSDSLGQAGQSLGRAVDAYSDKSQRLDAFTKASQSLLLEKGKLENDLLKTQIASANATLNQAGSPPPAPTMGSRYLMPGQGSTQGLIQDQAMSRTRSSPEAPSQEPGAIPEVGFGRSTTGYPVLPSADVKQRIEDMILPEIAWALRNQIAPMMSEKNLNPPFKAPYGKRWQYDWFRQEYQLVDEKPGSVILKLKPWKEVR